MGLGEFLKRIQHDYCTEHAIEDPQLVYCIGVVETTSRGPYRGGEKHLGELYEQVCSNIPTDRLKRPYHSINSIREKWFREFANQLWGIQQLGKTGRQEALEYLRYLSYEESREAGRGSGVGFGSDYIADDWAVEEHTFPHAKGPLKEFLYFEIGLTTSNWGNEQKVSEQGIRQQREQSKNWPPRLILNETIKTLEAAGKYYLNS